MLLSTKELEEAFKKLSTGEETVRSVASKLHIAKSTLHRYYLSWLSKRVEELESRYRSLEGEIREGLMLKEERDRLKSEIESLKKAREALSAQLETLTKEKEELTYLINGLIGYRSWLQNEVSRLLAEVSALQTQKEGLKQSVQAWIQYKKELEESA
jgi:chromosome segregation ATPase